MAVNIAIPLLFAALSAGANYVGQKKSQGAMDAANVAERNRQKRLDDRAFALNEQSRQRYDDAEGQQAERSEGLADLYRQATESAPVRDLPTAPQSDSNLVVAADAKASGEAKERVAENAENLAAFRSFADLFGDLGRAGQRDAGELNTIGSFKRGSAGVLPLELEAAYGKGDGWRTAGDIFSAASAITAPMALVAGGGGGLTGLLGSNAPLTALKPVTAGAAAGTPKFVGSALPALY